MNEDFEKWAKSTYGGNVIDNTPRYQSLPYLTDLKMAFLAGAAAMRERCAEIADNEANGFRNTRIAAAIRGMKI